MHTECGRRVQTCASAVIAQCKGTASDVTARRMSCTLCVQLRLAEMLAAENGRKLVDKVEELDAAVGHHSAELETAVAKHNTERRTLEEHYRGELQAAIAQHDAELQAANTERSTLEERHSTESSTLEAQAALPSHIGFDSVTVVCVDACMHVTLMCWARSKWLLVRGWWWHST